MAPSIAGSNLVYHLDLAATDLFGTASSFLFQTSPNLLNFAVSAINPTSLTFTLLLARKPATGEAAYMSMAYDVRRITYDVFTFARTPLKQITTTPIDKGLGPLVPIIGFTEYNVNEF